MFPAIIALLLPLWASAQNTLSGVVRSADDNQPLAGATLTVRPGNQTVSTDREGRFTLENLVSGAHDVEVRFIGYEHQVKSVQVPAGSGVVFTLKPASLIADEVIVRATRAGEKSATAFTNVKKADLAKNNLGQDLPFLLNTTPSLVVTSDAGAGIGYTGVRIRGSDATRTNITVNGIPLNDAESQGSFLVNLPDFASSVDNLQIQRGVGTSTNGAGAFGASINMQTTVRQDTAYAELNNSAGSFGTVKNTVSLGSGLINGKFSFDGRLSRIRSDGYIDRASSNLKSFFLSGAYYGKNDLLRVNVFSGSERTYQAWNGVPQDILQGGNRTFNEFTYPDQTDNYTQSHYQLIYALRLSDQWNLNAALHYTRGKGYYEEFKGDDDVANYGLTPAVIGGDTLATSTIIRRRWLDNDFYGATYSLNYKPENNLDFTLGGAYNEYDGAHFGNIISSSQALNIPADQLGNYEYYRDNAVKTDFNLYGKANLTIGKVSLYGDLQYRRIGYSFLGLNFDLTPLQQKVNLNFFNPKAGITYQIDPQNQVYASYAVANREPNRDDYTNSPVDNRPRAEHLQDLEAGYRFSSGTFSASANGYFMYYTNQLVLTGQINDVGTFLRSNVGSSYRAGAELEARWAILPQLNWNVNATISRNKVKGFTEVLDDYDNGGQRQNRYARPDIAFSPNIVGASELSFRPVKNAELALISKYVDRQYLDNTQSIDRSIDAYFVNDLRLAYTFRLKGVKSVGLSLLVLNLFNEKYVSNGYTYGYIAGGRQDFNFFFPQATTNFLAGLTVRF
ncbi:MAG: TonB-dependent receptor [Mucilaginibacter polytrichastri]|nr:TonB-dependent receptor [Mucilaginibacter polytrichastri]